MNRQTLLRTPRTLALGLATSAIALSGIAATAIPAHAATLGGPDCDGGWADKIQDRPVSLDAGGSPGWYFWHDCDGLHVRTTTPSDADHPFEAVFTSDGDFYDIAQVRTEGGDSVSLTNGGHRMVVTFDTHDGVDGVDFRVSGDHLRLRFEEFGSDVGTWKIYEGAYSVHPDDNPQYLNR